jgi:phosphoserine phosphatase RsbU/P
VDLPLVRRYQFPGELDSPVKARRIVASTLREAELDGLLDDAVLLTSELCENAIMHAGTGFELTVTVDDGGVTIAITDHGATAMELRRTAPSDRKNTHNRGLLLVDELSSEWGSRHSGDGHEVWFAIRSTKEPDEPPVGPPPTTRWPDVPTARWLLHIPGRTAITMSLSAQVAELLRRLCDVLGCDGGSAWVDYGDGERLIAGRDQSTEPGEDDVLTVPLPLSAPRKGRLRIHTADRTPTTTGIVELSAGRIALAVESDQARMADRDRWAWMTFLTEASELLGNSLDVTLTASVLPQIIVPRLGRWCAVHLIDEQGRLELAAVTHAEEAALPALTGELRVEPQGPLRRLVAGTTDVSSLPAPIEGVAVPIRSGSRAIGSLSAGRPADRAHTPEEIMMISEVARRAAQSLDNAQRGTTLATTAQALQQALLPRALPVVDWVRFAAAYLPVSAGADVGGDFYDVVAIGEDRWLIAVGDVCGNGPRAAARTSQVRDVLRVLIRDGQPLWRAVQLLNELMLEAEAPEQFATVALAVVQRDAAGITVELVLAGHERPILARSDGTVDAIGRHGSAVGLVSTFAVHPTQHQLEPGDTLVFYTDGIIERRDGDEQFGHERLASAVAGTAGAPAEDVVTTLLAAIHDFAPDTNRDDIVIMVVQIPEP